MEMNTAELKKGATKRCSSGLCKSHSSYPESMPWGTHFIRFVKVRKVKDEMTEWEKISLQRKRKNACIHVAEKVLQLFVEMVQLKKIHTQSMPHFRM